MSNENIFEKEVRLKSELAQTSKEIRGISSSLICPLCSDVLNYREGDTRDYRYNPPSVSCGCGFSFIEPKIKLYPAGQSALETEYQELPRARIRLLNKFTSR